MDPIEKLSILFEKFPGIGPKQAKRFVYFLLHSSDSYKKDLVQAIENLQNNTAKCAFCGAYFIKKDLNKNLCKICSDPGRDKTTIMLVEKETDISTIEQSGIFSGLYLVSLGTISPLDDSKKHQKFLEHIEKKLLSLKNAKELILAFSATFEGEYSAKYIKENLKIENLKVSMLGRGLSSGVEIEYADPDTLRYALKNRF